MSQPVSISARYRIETRLGAGGMGTIYRAFDRLTQQPVALKQILINPAHVQHNSAGGDPLLSLATEFRTLASLRHPHIVSVLDYGFDENRLPYYTMTLVDGARSLLDYGRSLDDSGKVRLLVELLQALAYLHRRGIIHRDLKPHNILVTPDGRLWVLDFGLARSLETIGAPDGNISGTLAYMAPELLNGASASVASDLYAVGVMLFELWANHHPFAGTTTPFVLTDVLLRPVDVSPLPKALASLAERLLAKTPEARPSRADVVIDNLCAAMNVPRPAESLSIRESFLQASTFVGREAELATLRGALNDALAGGAALWLVGGESGVGKSRLLDELRARALIAGALVMRGQAVAEGGLPFQLWREIARRLVLDATLTDLQAGVLKALVPDIGTLLGRDVPDAPELPGSAGQERLVFTLIDLFKRQEQPLVLLLEDLQWVEESLSPLKNLLTARDQFKRLLVVGTYRDDERPKLPEELTGMSVLKLPRLSDEAVAALARGMLGEAGKQPQVVRLLQRETEGNAFFMVDTVRALAEAAGSLGAVGIGALPSTVLAAGVQRISARRLERIPEAYRRLLRQVAVAGRQLDLAVLTHLADGQSESFLTVGADASVLEMVDGTWRFAHDKLREGILHALAAEELPAIHRIVAGAIEAAHPQDKAYDETLLGHWQAAGDTERELHYLLPVVKMLVLIRAAFAQAEPLIARGLSLLTEDDIRRAMLLNWRAEVSWRQAGYAAAQEQAQLARATAERLGGHAEVATSLMILSNVGEFLADFATARGASQQALELWRAIGDKKGIVDALSRLGSIARKQGDYATAEANFQQALVIAREINDASTVAIALGAMGIINAIQGKNAAAREFLEQTLALHRIVGDKRLMAVSLGNLANIVCQQGEYAVGSEYQRQSLALRQEIGDKSGVADSLFNLGSVSEAQADYAAARTYYQQSLALARELGRIDFVAVNLLSLCALAFEQDTPQVVAYLRECLDLTLEIRAHPLTMASLALIGRWWARQEPSNAKESARLAGLINAHAATDYHTREGYLNNLLHDLEALLPAEERAVLMAEGAKFDMQVTAREWQARLEALKI